jgi:hypothetical protein
MRTRTFGIGSAAFRAGVCASALYAAAGGAFADEYRPEDNACCFHEEPEEGTLPGLAFIGLGTSLGLLMAAYTNRPPAHPPFLRHVAAGWRSARHRGPPRLWE